MAKLCVETGVFFLWVLSDTVFVLVACITERVEKVQNISLSIISVPRDSLEKLGMRRHRSDQA